MFYTVMHAIKHYILYIIFTYIYIYFFQLSFRRLVSVPVLEAQMESRLQGEILKNSDTQMTPPLWQKVKRN